MRKKSVSIYTNSFRNLSGGSPHGLKTAFMKCNAEEKVSAGDTNSVSFVFCAIEVMKYVT